MFFRVAYKEEGCGSEEIPHKNDKLTGLKHFDCIIVHEVHSHIKILEEGSMVDASCVQHKEISCIKFCLNRIHHIT